MHKYHVALSFAGEDREYVEAVATCLKAEGVHVFYDLFEEEDLWGKDLYEHLSDVYKTQAVFTVMFISDAYTRKVWGKHERKSAQARALSESREYILPAYFDESIEVPGLLDTIAYVSLQDLSPNEFAAKIVKKLTRSGIELRNQFSYSESALQDIDFPLHDGHQISETIQNLKTCNWHKQNPAMSSLRKLKWEGVSSDQAFVLGRNIYQAACGASNAAVQFVSELRGRLATIPNDQASDLVNGMFFEVYFDKEGQFRGSGRLKLRCLKHLLTIQKVKKCQPSISFIRRVLEPYKNELPFMPNRKPEVVTLDLRIKRGTPPTIQSLTFREFELLVTDTDHETNVWRLAYQSFTVKQLHKRLCNEWGIPAEQLVINIDRKLDETMKLRLPEGKTIRWPRVRY